MTRRIRLFAAMLFLVGLSSIDAASFDCAKATTKVEKLVCADIALSAQDDALAATYRQAASLTKPASVRSSSEPVRGMDHLRLTAD